MFFFYIGFGVEKLMTSGHVEVLATLSPEMTVFKRAFNC